MQSVGSAARKHFGLGFEKMFDCFEYNGLSEEEARKRYYRKAKISENNFSSVIDDNLTNKFAMEILKVNGNAEIDLDERYAVVIVIEGSGSIKANDFCSDLKKSDNFFVTANSGKLNFSGNMTMVFCMPK